MTIPAYLNGQFIPADQARISVMDRGFLFGDAIYEVIPVYDGVPFLLKEHLQRLFYSLENIRMQSPMTMDAWEAVIATLIENSEAHPLLSVYIHVTRGAEARRSHTYQEGLTPTVYVECAPAIVHDYSSGVKAITVNEFRWGRCDIKSTNLLANILMKQQAKEAGALEAIILKDACVIEASSSNVFIVKDGVIKTPPLSHALLGGVTRGQVIALAKKHQLTIEETTISEDALRHADEVWVTGASKEIAPVIQLDDAPVGQGVVGPMALAMLDWYHEREA